MRAAPRERRLFALVLALAALVRFGAAIALWDRPIHDDERAYDEMAANLVAGRGFSTARPIGLLNRGFGQPSSLWGCAQPAYVAAVYAVFGRVPGVVYLGNVLLGLVPVWLAAAWAGRLGGQAALAAAGVIVALDVYLVKFQASLMTETLFIAALCAGLWHAERWAAGGGARRAIAAGALFGLATLTRALAFYLAFLVVLWVLWERRRSRAELGRGLAGFVLAMALVLAPWVARNLRVHDEPVFLDTKAGWNLYTTLHPQFEPLANNEVPLPPEVLDPSVSESRLNRIMLAGARDHLRTDPGHVLSMAPQKLYLLWSPLPGKLTSPRWAPVKLGFVLPLELLAAIGAVVLGTRHREVRLIYVVIGYVCLVHAVMTGGPRFRTPLDPLLAVAAGAALAWLWRRRRGRQSTSTSPSTPA